MRTTRTVSISLPPRQLRETEKLARLENRTMSELVREALRRYQQQRTVESSPVSSWATALAKLRDDALAKGSHKLSRREIDSEIAAVRRRSRKKR